MTPDPALFWLTLIAALPALAGGTLALLRPPEVRARRVALAAAVGSLVASGWVLVVHGLVDVAARTWLLHLGTSYALGLDALAAPFFLWVSACSVAAVLACDDVPTCTAVLALQSAALGMLASADALLWLSCFGGFVLAAAWLSGRMERVLPVQILGLGLLAVCVAKVSRMVFRQTGFPSTELARWESLTLFPSEERALLVLGGVALLATLAWLPAAAERASLAGRIALVGSSGLLLGHAALGVLLPLTARGGVELTGWGRALGVALLAYGALGREAPRRFVGYQGVVVLAIFTWSAPGLEGAALLLLVSGIGFVGILTAGATVARFAFVAYLATAAGWLAIAPLASSSGTLAVISGALLAVLLLRGRPRPAPSAPAGRPVRVALVLVACLASVAGASRWRSALAPEIARWLTPLSTEMPADPEPEALEEPRS